MAKEFGRLRELNGSAPILTDVDNVLNFEKNLSVGSKRLLFLN